MFPSSWLNNVRSSSTSCKSVREPDERCVATGPLQLTAKKATTIKKATANVLLLSILDFIPIPYLMLLAHLRFYAKVAMMFNFRAFETRILFPDRSYLQDSEAR